MAKLVGVNVAGIAELDDGNTYRLAPASLREKIVLWKAGDNMEVVAQVSPGYPLRLKNLTDGTSVAAVHHTGLSHDRSPFRV